MKKFESILQITLGIDNPDIENELPLCLFTTTPSWILLIIPSLALQDRDQTHH